MFTRTRVSLTHTLVNLFRGCVYYINTKEMTNPTKHSCITALFLFLLQCWQMCSYLFYSYQLSSSVCSNSKACVSNTLIIFRFSLYLKDMCVIHFPLFTAWIVHRWSLKVHAKTDSNVVHWPGWNHWKHFLTWVRNQQEG
jgi:hypothetical protein